MSYREMLLNNIKAFGNNERKIAIYGNDCNISYKQFNREVLGLSQRIVEEYGADNEVVAVRMRDPLNSLELILALLFANKVILPIPLEVPEEKAIAIIEDIKPSVIFTDNGSVYENSVDYCEFKRTVPNDAFVPPKYDDESRFIIIMTSGTTGSPKGCCLTDKAFLGRVYDLYKKFGFKENDNYLFSSNYSFDVSYTQILTWLFGKGSITIQDKGDDFRSIPDYVNTFGITHLAISPAVLTHIYSHLLEKTNSIKDVFVAGEKFPTIVAEKCIEQHPYFNLWNMYGPTEFSIYATYFNVLEYKKTDNGVPIGYELDGVAVKILDSEDNLIVEDRVEGQILLGGKGCFLEYINNRDKTLSSLITIGDMQYYKTGDMGCFIGNKFYFHGRKDHQLKINGIRVEAEEIERIIIEKCPEIESIIIKLLNYRGKSQLVAFLVLRDKNIRVDLPIIKKRIQAHIESYFIPKVLFVLDKIPLNKNGKIDNDKLQEIYLRSKVKKTNRETALSDNIKDSMREIWQSVLNIHITDDYASVFDLGADSIDIVVLLAEIEEYFGVELRIEDIYRYSNINDMAAFVFGKNSNDKISEINKALSLNKFNGFLQEINFSTDKKTILYSDEDRQGIISFVNDTFGIEFVPNYHSPINAYGHEHSKTLLRNGELSEEEGHRIKQLIIEQIEKNAKHIENSLCNNNSITYECGPGQNKIFRKKYNDLVINKTKLETLDVENIKCALNQVVRQQSLLRSMIIMHEGKYFFKEWGLKNSFEIEVLDLEQCDYGDYSSDLLIETIFNYLGQLEKENNLLFRWLLVKKDIKTYELITVFSHLISDAAGSNVFSKEIVLSLNSIFEKASDKKQKVKYTDYLDELNTNYSNDKYLKFVNSAKYADIVNSSSRRNKDRNLSPCIIKVPIASLQPLYKGLSSKEGAFLWLSAQLASVVLEKNSITFRVTNNGRVLGNNRFDNLLGDCHVHFPLIINCEKDDVYSCHERLISEYNYYYVENKLYLEDLCYSQKSASNNEIERMFDNLDFVFNYIGEMDERASEEYCKSVRNDRNLYKTYYIYCYATKDNFILNCRLPRMGTDSIVGKFYDIIYKSNCNNKLT